MAKIKVKDVEVSVIKFKDNDYICLTDMVKTIENGTALIEKWLRNKNTIVTNTDTTRAVPICFHTFFCNIQSPQSSLFYYMKTSSHPFPCEYIIFMLYYEACTFLATVSYSH